MKRTQSEIDEICKMVADGMAFQCECLAAWVDTLSCICDDDKYRDLLTAIRNNQPVYRQCKDMRRANITEVHISDEDFDRLVRNPFVEPSYIAWCLSSDNSYGVTPLQLFGIKFNGKAA